MGWTKLYMEVTDSKYFEPGKGGPPSIRPAADPRPHMCIRKRCVETFTILAKTCFPTLPQSVQQRRPTRFEESIETASSVIGFESRTGSRVGACRRPASPRIYVLPMISAA